MKLINSGTVCIILIFVLLNLQLSDLTQLNTKNGKDFAENITKILSNTLQDLLQEYTNYKEIDAEFQNLFQIGGLELFKRNGEELNRGFTGDIERLFESKTKLLEKISRKASALKSSFTEPDITNFKSPVNVRDVEFDNVTLKIYPTFSNKIPINMTQSFVQVPTNIYSKSKTMLSTAKWTEDLDVTFKENFDNQSDATLLYQYFCDSSGLFRIYPGNQNGYDPKETDLYDCRHRVWYIQASSSPKDVIIVVDTSGSMTGNNIAIAKIAAASLIDTLQENDYFNVITINKEVHYIHDCVKHLLQATKANKEIMKHKLSEIKDPYGPQNMDLGITEAFDLLLETGTKYNRTSSNCNKAMMILTDGVEGSYAGKKIFENRNKDKTVRAFGFLVGRKGSPDKGALEKMACKNRGEFYQIQTLGNIWDTVLEYIRVLSRPMGQSNDTHIVNYTPVYLDSTGLGMVITLSMGVFHNKELIGVTGTDILVDSLKEIIPNEKLGVFSHNVMINNNGFMLLHPHFREQSGYLPIPPNIYLEDLERGYDLNEISALKLDMINQETSNRSFNTYILYDNHKRIAKSRTEYYFNAIKKSEFSSATALHDIDLIDFVVNDTTADQYFSPGINSLKSFTLASETQILATTANLSSPPFSSNVFAQISPWKFCNKTAKAQQSQPKSVKTFPTAHEIYDYLKNIENFNQATKICDSGLVAKLLTSAGIVDKHSNESWKSAFANKIQNDSIKSAFVLTSGGYSKYFQFTNDTKPFSRDVQNTSIYKLAAATGKVSIIVSVSLNNEDKLVTLAKASRQGSGDDKILSAVSGIKVSSDYIYQMFTDTIKKANNMGKEKFSCDDKDEFVCIILDHNGYIVTSNRDTSERSYNGKFISELVGPLVEHLINHSIFNKVVLDDTQAECEKDKNDHSSAHILLTPAKILVNALKIFFKTTQSLTIKLFMLIYALLSHRTVESATGSRYNVSCTKEMRFFLFNEEKWKSIHTSQQNFARQVECSKNCMQSYELSQIKDTNLLFLIADIPCGVCLRNGLKLIQSKQKGTDFCDTTSEKYRREPKYCFNQTVEKEEEKIACRGAMDQPSLFMLSFFLLIVLLTRW